MINAVEVLKKAYEGHYAIGQFNISNLEGIKAVFGAMERTGKPVIIATSEGEGRFIGRRQIVKLIEAYQEETEIPIILNADHTKSFGEIKLVVDAGYNAVHFDGSALPFEENLKITKDVVEYAKSKNENILVEGELGYLRGGSDVHEAVEIFPDDMTDPEQAKQFIEETKIDSLAIVIGNVHGIVTTGNPELDIERLKRIKRNVSGVFLVLHGGSGIADNNIKEAIDAGINKININTELRLAYINSLRKVLKENPEQSTPYKIFPEVIEEVGKVVENKIKLFSGA